jgi:hypothetical protein
MLSGDDITSSPMAVIYDNPPNQKAQAGRRVMYFRCPEANAQIQSIAKTNCVREQSTLEIARGVNQYILQQNAS